ncbi:hypothetical protein ACRALDRAFT_211064 [Sodiomyces alcalophilus JCM 7366]|uniref:uncharacterized protein n=1 Tax=Sodiomyces alcalophilus JCM 7366 TaxID=591952 RepID=UPI0039B45A61
MGGDEETKRRVRNIAWMALYGVLLDFLILHLHLASAEFKSSNMPPVRGHDENRNEQGSPESRASVPTKRLDHPNNSYDGTPFAVSRQAPSIGCPKVSPVSADTPKPPT